MMKIVLEARYDAEEIGEEQNCFSDVAQDRYAPYVCYAKDHDIVRGYPDGTFGPEQSVTVAEGLKIALESYEMDIEEKQARDRYAPYIDFVHTQNLFSRYALHPDRPLTRGEMSFLVHHLDLIDQ